MRFLKMQGLGNDYVYINCLDRTPDDLPELARRVSDRHFGVGSDGLICICPSEVADVRMRMFNADGSEGKMCGNGVRCVGKFVYDEGLVRKTELTVETLAGIRTLALQTQDGLVRSATVDMGPPTLEPLRTVTVNGETFSGLPVSMGNPHFVIQVPSVHDFPLSSLALLSAPNPTFSEGVNVEIVARTDAAHLRMRVWERGSGETMACGTGACAVVAAFASQGLCQRMSTVALPGGELLIRWDEEDGHIYMTGPAVTVFEGEWPQ